MNAIKFAPQMSNLQNSTIFSPWIPSNEDRSQLPSCLHFDFFLLFLHIVIKGKRFAKREWNEKWCYICLHIAQWQKKNPQTATPVLSSSRIICKICNLFSKFFTYVYIYNRRRRRSVSLFVQNLFLVGVEVTRKFFNLWSINTHSGGK